MESAKEAEVTLGGEVSPLLYNWSIQEDIFPQKIEESIPHTEANCKHTVLFNSKLLIWVKNAH